MPTITATIPTDAELKGLSDRIGQVHAEIEEALFALRAVSEKEGVHVDAAQAWHLTYFAEGLSLDASNLTRWADSFKALADELYGGYETGVGDLA